MDTIRIVHHGFPGGYLINAHEYVAATMTRYDNEAPPPPLPAPVEPLAEMPRPAKPRKPKAGPEAV